MDAQRCDSGLRVYMVGRAGTVRQWYIPGSGIQSSGDQGSLYQCERGQAWQEAQKLRRSGHEGMGKAGW